MLQQGLLGDLRRGVDLSVCVNNILNYKSVACDTLPLSYLMNIFRRLLLVPLIRVLNVL